MITGVKELPGDRRAAGGSKSVRAALLLAASAVAVALLANFA